MGHPMDDGRHTLVHLDTIITKLLSFRCKRTGNEPELWRFTTYSNMSLAL